MRRQGRPLPLRLLARWLPGALGADVLEDFEESWLERRRQGRWRAALWLWRQVMSPHTLRLARMLKRRTARRWERVDERRTTGGGGTMTGWVRQIRYAARGLAMRPGFTLTVTVTLALGIGANTAIFSVVDGILLEPLPYPDGDRLVFVWGAVEGDETVLLSGPQGAEAMELGVFTQGAQIFGFGSTSMVRSELPEPIRTLTVGHTFFDLFGVPPMLGRGFRAEDEYKLTNEQIRDPHFERPVQAVMLSYHFWRQTFAGDPGVLGRVIRIGGHRHEIVGVMPQGFRAHLPAELEETTPEDVWIMSPYDQPSFPRDTRFVRVVGRLAEGASLKEAQAALDRLSSWQRETFFEDARDGFRMRAASMQSEAGATARGPLLLLLTAVGFVLLIACANVATLLLVRATDRDGEMRVRRALGASRSELAGTGVAESLLASALGGMAGALLAPLLTRILVGLAPPELPRVDAIGVDGSVLLFTAVVTVGVALVAGLLPAIRASRSTVANPGARGTASASHLWTGKILVATEVALAVVLVIASGLLLRSLGNVFAVDPGFETRGVFAWEANLTTPTHPTWASRVAYFRGVQEALLAQPGVQAVGVLTPVPFDGADRTEIRLGMMKDAPRIVADLRRAGPGALEALGIEVVDGRSLEWRDVEDFDRLHAVVDERFAARAWSDESAVGRVISLIRREYGEGSDVWDEWKRVEVVGVVRPIRGRDVRRDDPPTVYVTYSQNMWGSPAFLVRAELPLTAVAVREAAAEADPRPLLRHFTSLESVADRRLASLRFALTLIGLFAGLGLVLAATGVYGLLAYTVGNRQQELHIRSALGASRRQLSHMVLRSGLVLTGVGVLIGWLGAWGLTRFLSSLLYEVTPTDPVTFLGVAAFLTVVALLACWVPSRRAGRTQPAAALR